MGYQNGMFSFPVGLCIFLLYLTCFNCLRYERIKCTNSNDIDAFIYGLDYDPDRVLVYKPPGATNYVSKEGSLDNDGSFIVLEREKKNVSGGTADIAVISNAKKDAFPGALLLANSNLLDNKPDVLNVGRAPIKYNVDLPGMTDGASFTIVPSYTDYQRSLNKVLDDWFNNYRDYEIMVQTESTQSMAYSMEQLKVSVGAEVSAFHVAVQSDFERMDNRTKSVFIHKCKQIFYTVSVESPKKPSDLFNREVTRELLISRKVNSSNPPVLVDSVSYGRLVFVKITSSSTYTKEGLTTKVKVPMLHVGAHTGFENAKELNDSNMNVWIIGGGSKQDDLIAQTEPSAISRIISETGKFGKKNLGFPLAYSTQFIKDNGRAAVISATSYTQTTRTVYNKGLIRLEMKGVYVGKFKVTWNKVSYNELGEKRTKEEGWNKNGKHLTDGFEATIELNGNCANLSVLAEEATGLAWESWRTVIKRTNIPLIGKRTFKIGGTTLSPSCKITPPIPPETDPEQC